jgi:hypothetical protein
MEELGKLKKKIGDLIGNRTWDLPTCKIMNASTNCATALKKMFHGRLEQIA